MSSEISGKERQAAKQVGKNAGRSWQVSTGAIPRQVSDSEGWIMAGDSPIIFSGEGRRPTDGDSSADDAVLVTVKPEKARKKAIVSYGHQVGLNPFENMIPMRIFMCLFIFTPDCL